MSYILCMNTLSHLESQVLQLPEDQRVSLVNRILQSAEPSQSSDVETAWHNEIVRRIKNLDSGVTQRISASEVFDDLEKQFS